MIIVAVSYPHLQLLFGLLLMPADFLGGGKKSSYYCIIHKCQAEQ